MKSSKVCIMAALLIGILLIAVGCADGQTSQQSEEVKSDLASELEESYDLKPLSETDANYTINMGYYNCDHMTAACIGQDASICCESFRSKSQVDRQRQCAEAMAAGENGCRICRLDHYFEGGS